VKAGQGSVWAWRIGILLVCLAAWEYLTGIKAISKTPGLYWVDPFFISRPSAIARRFVYLLSDNVRLPLWRMALSTVQSTLWGFLVGITSGFVAGLLLGRSDRIARIFDPFIVAFNSLPRIALVPLITMVFGFGLLAKIVLAWSIVFFIVFFNTFQGARSVDADLVHSARFLGAHEGQILRTVIVPSTLAWTFASLTPSISFALIGVVQVFLITAVAVFGFRVPLRGSFPLLLGLTLLFLLVTLGVGLLVSTLVRNQQQAMMAAAFLAMIPMVYLSGLIFPIENMPPLIQLVTYLVPLRYYAEIIRGVFLRGSGISVLWPEALTLLLMGLAILTIAALRFRKRLD